MIKEQQELSLRIRNDKIWNEQLNRKDLAGRLQLPLNPTKIPKFQEWMRFNDFNEPDPTHNGTDFAAYIDRQGSKNLGLPRGLTIYAILPGFVYWVTPIIPEHKYCGLTKEEKAAIYKEDCYNSQLNIIHSANGQIASLYGHVIPSVKSGQWVGGGQEIGYLYSYPGNQFGRLVHLHLEIGRVEPEYKAHVADDKMFERIDIQGINFAHSFDIKGKVDAFALFYPGKQFEHVRIPYQEQPYNRRQLGKIGIKLRNFQTLDLIMEHSY